MAGEYARQIGSFAAQLQALKEDIVQLRADHQSDHHRLRSVESSVAVMLDAHKSARRGEETNWRRLEIRMQAMMVVIAIAAIIVPLTLVLVHH